MTDKWKDRIIRGGFIVVAVLGLTGAVIGMAGYAAGEEPPVLRAGAVILVTAALIGAACVAAVQFPSRPQRRRRRRRGNT